MRTSWIGAAGLLVAVGAACGSPVDALRNGGESLAYTAQSTIMESFPVQINAWVSIHNAGSNPQTVRLPDGCKVTLRVHRTADRSGAPAWDQLRTIGCHQAVVPVTMHPGETVELGAPIVPANEILGDSLPDGRYWLSVVIRPDGERLELPAGETDLAVSR